MDRRRSLAVVKKKRSRQLTSPLVQVPVVAKVVLIYQEDKKRSRLLQVLKQERHFISFFLCALACILGCQVFRSILK